jgi:hypothetical protein
MRIYLPATLPMLREVVRSGELRPVHGIGFAVTDELRAEYPGADTEDLEYLAMHDAALASLRLIAADGCEPVRVVMAVDTDARATSPDAASAPVASRADLDRAVVTVAPPIAWGAVASVHLDGGDVAATISAAADAVTAADLGDMDAALAVGDAEDIDLGWYAPGEIGYLVTELSSP